MNHSIYFIAAEEVGRFKIGRTGASSAVGRLAALQVGSPCDLKLVYTAHGPVTLEESCHLAASHLKFQYVRGEWFTGQITTKDCKIIVEEARRFEALVSETENRLAAIEDAERQAAINAHKIAAAKRRGDISVSTTTAGFYHHKRVERAMMA